jgi:hypothetical protein
MDITKINFNNATVGEVQAAVRAFVEDGMSMPEFVDGQVVMPPPRRVTPAFLATHLGGDGDRADALMAELVNAGYLDRSGKPLAPAMALAHDKGLPRIGIDAVKRIIATLVCEAGRLNALPDARVFIEHIDLFGSTLREGTDFGDVDVVVHLTPPTDDFTPEDIEEQDEVLQALQAVSEHINMAPPFDEVAAQAEKKTIFSR